MISLSENAVGDMYRRALLAVVEDTQHFLKGSDPFPEALYTHIVDT